MPTVYRVTAVWSGFIGAPGYSKFSFGDLTDASLRQAAVDRVAALFTQTRSWLQTSWSVQVQQSIDQFDMETGLLTGTSTAATKPPVVNGLASAVAYAGGSGYCITWNTGLIYNGRRVRGRTFRAPTVRCLDTDGTLTSSALTNIGGAADTFIGPSAPRPAIWAKIFGGADGKTQVGGALAPIDSYKLRDGASQLRSRRM